MRARAVTEYLEIDRGNGFSFVDCPHNATGRKCGQWCALFGDTEIVIDVAHNGLQRKKRMLSLCSKKIEVEM
jgi:hypothetical protein